MRKLFLLDVLAVFKAAVSCTVGSLLLEMILSRHYRGQFLFSMVPVDSPQQPRERHPKYRVFVAVSAAPMHAGMGIGWQMTKARKSFSRGPRKVNPGPGQVAAQTIRYIAKSAELYSAGRIKDAQEVAHQGLLLDPTNPVLQVHSGTFALILGDLAAAEAAFRRATEIQPNYGEAHCNLGLLLFGQRRLAEAETAYRRAIAEKPSLAEAHSNLGLLLYELKRLDEAEASYRLAIALEPNYAEACSNLGVLLDARGRPAEAEAAYQRAINLRPDYADAYSNLGLLLHGEKRFDEAEIAYRRAIALRPGCPEPHLNLGMLLLRRGRFQQGWEEYEARYAPGNKNGRTQPPPALADGPTLPPRWRGEPLAGKSLLVWPEQGLGDTIQFVRYLATLRTLAVRHITLACQPPLKTLLEQSSLADRVIDTGEWQPGMSAEFDFWTYLLSLPGLVGTTLDTVPARIPYLAADPARKAKWANYLPAAPKRIGLVWKGSTTHENDRNRSIPSLSVLAPLWTVPGVAFVSLQKGAGEDEGAAPPASQPLVNLGPSMRDFSDSAAIMSQLDLLITVDTAAAHLAGALGIPCWVLLPAYRTDWRWMDDRADCPWYPERMRLFRQNSTGDWGPVIGEVVAALGAKQSLHHAAHGTASPVDTNVVSKSYVQRVEARYGPCYIFTQDEFLGRSVFSYGEYNKDECEYVVGLANLRPGLVLDIGANIGNISQALIAAGHRVVAFEPQPEVYELLELNCPAAQCYNLALGSKCATVQMPAVDYSQRGNFGGLGIGTGTGLAVEVRTLDSFAFDNVSLIKIDVEGFEEEVLRGATETIRRWRPIIYLEADRPEKLDSLARYLQYLGYDFTAHNPPLFNPDNYFGNRTNIWGQNYVSFNWDCRPRELSA